MMIRNMTRMQEQLEIVFRKKVYNYGVSSFYAEHTGSISKNGFIAQFLGFIEIPYCNEIIRSIERAENGLPYLSYHEFDILNDDFEIDIIPPNVSWGQGAATMPMEDWKQLMIEWRDFQMNNS